MAHFPFYMDIAGKRGVVIGGGRIAAGKIAALLPFSPRLVCIAPVICEEIRRLAEAGEKEPGGLRLICRAAQKEDLEGAFFVIAATDSPETNAWAAELCREKGILINAADDRKNCSFYFPALVRRGPVTVGISTGGCSPAAASWLRRKMERMLPQEMGDAVEQLGALRDRVKENMPEAEERAAFLKRLFAWCEGKDFQLENGELEGLLETFLREKGTETEGKGSEGWRKGTEKN